MNDSHFDLLVHLLATRLPRRSMAGALGTHLLVAPSLVAAKKKGKHGKPKKKDKPKSPCAAGKTVCPRNSATRCCPASDPVCCPRTDAVNALCCQQGQRCCPPGQDGTARCCPEHLDCCPGRSDTSAGYPVCCAKGCCASPDDCTQDQQCSDTGCCYEACPNNQPVCFNACCQDGFVCVTSHDGLNQQCCAEADACPGSRTGCCGGGLTCIAIVNPQPGQPDHACQPSG